MQEVLRVRTSERRDFARCRQKWWWGYVEGLKPNNTSAPLAFGDLVHQALALYYIPGKKRGPEPVYSFVRLWDQFSKHLYGIWTDEGEFEDAFELGREMMVNYVQDMAPLDRQFEVIAPEQPIQVRLYDSENGDLLCVYVGQLDAVVRWLETGKIGLLEHKTTKGLPPDYWLPMDEQAGSYWTFAPPYLRNKGIMKPDEDLDFILYNFLRKAKKDIRPTDAAGRCLNKDGSISKVQPSPLFHRELVYRNPESRNAMVRRVEWQVTEMQWVREGKLPVIKNPTKDCRWDCQFKDMCELHESGADWESFRDAMYTQWEPYEAHLDIPTEATR